MANKQTKFDVKALREKVMTSDDIQYDEVYVSEWDVTLPVKTLSTADMKKVYAAKKDEIRMMILAVLYGCKTPDGEAVFQETDLAKFEDDKSFAAIAKVAERVFEISGEGEEQAKAAKNA